MYFTAFSPLVVQIPTLIFICSSSCSVSTAPGSRLVELAASVSYFSAMFNACVRTSLNASFDFNLFLM